MINNVILTKFIIFEGVIKMIEDRIKKNNTIVPDSILKKIGGEEGDKIKYNINKEGNIEIEIEEKEISIEELASDLGMNPSKLRKELDEANIRINKGEGILLDVDNIEEKYL